MPEISDRTIFVLDTSVLLSAPSALDAFGNNDVVLPIIDFGQDDAWRPNSRASWGWLGESLRWGFIATGWALASIFVAAFTNLIRRD